MLAAVLLIAAAAIVGCAVAMATGRGGEMAMFQRGHAVPLALRTPADVAAVRLPLAIVGYQPEATSAVLTQVARLLADRDDEIARLRGDQGDPGRADDSAGSAS